MIKVSDIIKFVESSKLCGEKFDFMFEYKTNSTVSFIHPTGVRLVVLYSSRVRSMQFFFGSVGSSASLWFWDEIENGWKIENYDCFGGNIGFRTLSDFLCFFELEDVGTLKLSEVGESA